MVKRSNGSGSVYRRSNGKWIAAWITPEGKRKTKSANTKREAEAKLRELRQGTHEPQFQATPPLQESSPHLSEWTAQWLDLRASQLRPSTLHSYQQSLKMILPDLGDIRLHDLTPLAVSLAYAGLRRAGRGQRQVQRSFTYLRTCLDAAVSMGLIPENPLRRVEMPKHTPAEKRYWSREEWQRFLGTTLASRRVHAPLFAFLATTGLRISEALALTWDDVDMAGGYVSVTKALVCVNDTAWHEMPPKSAAGKRRVSLPLVAGEALMKLPTDRQRVFYHGNPPMRRNLYRDLHSFCDLAGVPYVSIHGLRHVAATMALKATRDAHAVRRRLGHSHVSTTIGIYGYALEDEDSIAGALDRLLAAD